MYSYCIPIQLCELAVHITALVKKAELLQSTSTAVEQKSTSRAGGKQAVEGNALAEAGLHLVSPAMAASPPLQQIEKACAHKDKYF